MGQKIKIPSRKSLAKGNKVQKNNCAKTEHPNSVLILLPYVVLLIPARDWGWRSFMVLRNKENPRIG